MKAKRKVKFVIAYLILFILVCINAEHTNAREVLSTIVTPEQYGANGKDKLDDTEALQMALESSTHVRLTSGHIYYISSPLRVKHSTKITTTSSGKANIIKTTMTKKERALHVQYKVVANPILKSSVKKGLSYIDVTDTNGVEPGQLLHLQSSELWEDDNRDYLSKGELQRISKVEPQRIYFEKPLNDSYNLNKETITINVYENRKLEMSNLSFSYPRPFDSKVDLIYLGRTTNSRLTNIEVKNSKAVGIALDRNYGTTITGASINLGTTREINTGYGIQDSSGAYNKVLNSTFKNVRRAVDFSGVTPARFGYVGNSKATGPAANSGKLAWGNSGFGTHSTAENIVFEKNTVVGFNYSFLSRGKNITIQNNSASGNVTGFAVASYGDNLTVTNNKFRGTAEYFVLIDSTFKDGLVTVRRNDAKGIKKKFIQVKSSKTKLKTASNHYNQK